MFDCNRHSPALSLVTLLLLLSPGCIFGADADKSSDTDPAVDASAGMDTAAGDTTGTDTASGDTTGTDTASADTAGPDSGGIDTGVDTEAPEEDASTTPPSEKKCGNGKDDDGDNHQDCEDPDCHAVKCGETATGATKKCCHVPGPDSRRCTAVTAGCN